PPRIRRLGRPEGGHPSAEIQGLVDSIDRRVDFRVVPGGRRLQHPVESPGDRKTLFRIGKAHRGYGPPMAKGRRRGTASRPGGCGAVVLGINYETQSSVERKIENSIFESNRMAGDQNFEGFPAYDVAASVEQRFIETAQLANRAAAVAAGPAIRQRLARIAKI